MATSERTPDSLVTTHALASFSGGLSLVATLLRYFPDPAADAEQVIQETRDIQDEIWTLIRLAEELPNHPLVFDGVSALRLAFDAIGQIDVPAKRAYSEGLEEEAICYCAEAIEFANEDAGSLLRCTASRLSAVLVPGTTLSTIPEVSPKAAAGDPSGQDKASGGRPKRKRQRKGDATPRPLTPKQVEAVRVVAECEENISKAARRLGCDPSTVRQHYEAAQMKLGKKAVKHQTQKLPQDKRGQESLCRDDERRR